MNRERTFPRRAASALRRLAALLLYANLAVAPAFGQTEYDRLLAEYESAKAAYDQASAAWRQENDSFTAAVHSFNDDSTDYERQTAQLESDVAPVIEASEEYERQAAQLVQDGQAHENAVHEHNRRVAAIDDETARCSSDVETHNAKADALKQEAAEYSDAVAAYNINVADHRGAVALYDNEKAAYHHALDYYESKPEEERTQFEYDRIVRWKQELDRRFEQLNSMKRRLDEAKAMLDAWQKTLIGRETNLINESRDLERAREDLQKRGLQSDEDKRQFDDQASRLVNRQNTLEQTRSSLEARRAELQARIDANERARADLVGRRDELKNREAELQRRKGLLDEQLAALERMMDRLEQLVDPNEVSRSVGPTAKNRGLTLEQPATAPPATRRPATAQSSTGMSAAEPSSNDRVAPGEDRSAGPGLRNLSAAASPSAAPAPARTVALKAAAKSSNRADEPVSGVTQRAMAGGVSIIRAVPRISAVTNLEEKTRGPGGDRLDHLTVPRKNTAAAAAVDQLPKLRGLSGDGDDLDARAAELRRRRAAREARIREIQNRISELEGKKATARRELERIVAGAPGINQALDEWANLAVDARNEAQEQAVITGLSLILADQSDLNGGSTVKQAQLDEIQKKVFQTTQPPKELLDEMPRLLAEIREINGVNKLLDFLENSLTVRAMAKAVSKKKYAELLKEVVGLFVKDPRAKAVLADVELVTAVGYAYTAGHFARAEVDRLNEFTIQQLEQVRIYGGMLRDCTDEINELKRKLRSL